MTKQLTPQELDAKFEDLITKSKKGEEKLKPFMRELTLKYDEGLVNVRKQLKATNGSLELKTEGAREFFKTALQKQLTLVGLEDHYRGLGQTYPGDGSIDKTLNNVQKMIITQYVGVDIDRLNSDLIDTTKDFDKTMNYLAVNIRQGLPDRIDNLLRADFHDHLRIAPLEGRQYVAEKLNLGKYLEPVGITEATKTNNYVGLGKMIGDYFKNNQSLSRSVVEDAASGAYEKYLK